MEGRLIGAEGIDTLMALSDYVNTFGQLMFRRYGGRVYKIALDAGFTCPNRDGTKGVGGCTFCNNASFSPNTGDGTDLDLQFASHRRVLASRAGAHRFIAYFQSYTNTYAHIGKLRELYQRALAYPGVIGLSVGTRPDCVSDEVLRLLAQYRQQGLEIWLELGLQSAFDETLQRVNRGHGLSEYREAATAARTLGIPVCTHLIVGLPGETDGHYHATLETVLKIGVDGLKLHPLHVVKRTLLANQWRRGEYTPLTPDEYIRIACDLIEHTPPEVVFHRVTGTAPPGILLAPAWCSSKWRIVNGIEQELRRRNGRQGHPSRHSTDDRRWDRHVH